MGQICLPAVAESTEAESNKTPRPDIVYSVMDRDMECRVTFSDSIGFMTESIQDIEETLNKHLIAIGGTCNVTNVHKDDETLYKYNIHFHCEFNNFNKFNKECLEIGVFLFMYFCCKKRINNHQILIYSQIITRICYGK